MNGKRYNIGLLINELESGYALSVSRGAAELAERICHDSADIARLTYGDMYNTGCKAADDDAAGDAQVTYFET